jgi:MscS family membrane protein
MKHIQTQLLDTQVARIILCLTFIFGCLLSLSGSICYAQEQAQPPTPTISAPVILPDNDLRSPRATVAAFLAAMDPSDGKIDIEKAVKALDLSEIPDLVRTERGEEVAIKLFAALDHVGFTAGKAPAAASVDAVQITEIGGYGVHLERNGPNWRFSRATVADTPAIFREIEANLSKKDMRTLGALSNLWLTVRTYVPESLKGTTFLVEDWQWLAGMVAIVLLIFLHRIIISLCRWLILSALAPRLGLPPTLNLKPLGRPVAVVLFTTALQLFLLTIDLPVTVYSSAVAWLSTIRIVALVVLGVYLIDIFGERLSIRANRTASTIDDVLYPLVQKALWVIVILVGIAQVLSVHGVNVSGLVAGLGLGGLAFALAAKDTIENIFGSVAILIDQPFRIGDAINVGGVSGTVEHIGLRSTRLRTPDNSLVSMPNSKVIAGHVDNLGARPYLRTRAVLNVAYDTTPQEIEALCAGIRELLSSHPECKRDSAVVFLNEFNPASLGVLVQFQLIARDWTTEQRIKDQIFLAILTLVQELQIRLTAPPQEVKVTQAAEQPTRAAPATSEKAVETAKRMAVRWQRLAE